MKISIEAARVNAKLTITEAAKELGVSVGSLSAYENGRAIPRFDVVEKMSGLYNMPIENLRVTEEG
jgi:transcriptional regulator with XRE-family HTH domain